MGAKLSSYVEDYAFQTFGKNDGSHLQRLPNGLRFFFYGAELAVFEVAALTAAISP